MKRIAHYLCLAMTFVFMLFSVVFCVKEPEISEGENSGIDEGLVAIFIEKSDYGLYDGNTEPEYLLDLTDQMIYNVKSKRFIIVDENRSAVLTAVLSEREEPEFYTVELSSSLENVKAGQFIMKAVRQDGDRLWLWENSNSFGLVILYEQNPA